MEDRLQRFRENRMRQNGRVLERATLGIKRFLALDERTYESAALDSTTKELMGLAVSMALRCDDCVSYHLIRCAELGASDEQMMEAMEVALTVGGSIVIPHLRRAVDLLDEIRSDA